MKAPHSFTLAVLSYIQMILYSTRAGRNKKREYRNTFNYYLTYICINIITETVKDVMCTHIKQGRERSTDIGCSLFTPLLLDFFSYWPVLCLLDNNSTTQ